MHHLNYKSKVLLSLKRAAAGRRNSTKEAAIHLLWYSSLQPPPFNRGNSIPAFHLAQTHFKHKIGNFIVTA